MLADDSFGLGGGDTAPDQPLPTMDLAAGFADTQPSPQQPPTLDSAPIDTGEPLDLDDLSFGDQPASPPATMSSPADETVLAGDLFSDSATPMEPAPMAAPPIVQQIEEPVTAAPVQSEAPSPLDLATTSPIEDNSLETNFESPALAASNGLDLDFPEADISSPSIPDSIVPENTDAYDVSSSDLRIDPTTPEIGGASDSGAELSTPEEASVAIPAMDEAPVAPPVLDTSMPDAEPLDVGPLEAAPLESGPFDSQPSGAEPIVAEPMVEAEPMAPMSELEPVIETARTVEPSPSLESRGSGTPDLSPMMRDRIHDTLEKVAWEAFADLSESIVKQVLERVEQVAWEVIPQMAETLIQEEIRRMKDETE